MPAPKLVATGLIAAALSAGLAFVLQLTLVSQKPSAPSAAIVCVVAARDLSAGQRITESDLEQVELAARPSGESIVSSRALAIGRMLAVALTKGQALRSADLVVPGTGASIASQLEPGLRAITVTLRDSGPEVVLYPGALVDVLATLERPARANDQRETVTLTLLEAVRVLAVNDEAVGTKAPAEPAPDRRATSRKLTVTLAVTPEQAAEVELASARGTVGIALRSDREPTAKSPGVSVTARSILGLPDGPPAPAPDRPASSEVIKPAEPAKTPPPPPAWRVNITRGGATTTHDMPESKTSAPRQPLPSP